MIKIFSFFLHVVFVDSSLSFNDWFFLIKKKAEQRSRNTFHIFIWTYIIHCVEKTMPPNFYWREFVKIVPFYDDCYVKYNVKSKMKFQNSWKTWLPSSVYISKLYRVRSYWGLKTISIV